MVFVITCNKGLTDVYYYCFILYLNRQASGMATKCEFDECFTTLRHVVLIVSKADYSWQIKVRITTTIGDWDRQGLLLPGQNSLHFQDLNHERGLRTLPLCCTRVYNVIQSFRKAVTLLRYCSYSNSKQQLLLPAQQQKNHFDFQVCFQYDEKYS